MSMSERPEPCVHLVQLLCPKRHCIIGTAYLPGESNHDEVVDKLEARRIALRLNPWCGICGSRELRFEDRPAPYQTMDEALPALRETERENLESRAYLEKMGLTYDSQPQN